MKVKKKNLFGLILAGLMMLGIAGSANAAVIDFEGLVEPDNRDGYISLPDGYSGFNWSNMGAIDYRIGSVGSGYEHGAISGTSVAFNWAAQMAITSAGTSFDFNGAWFTAAWIDNTLKVEGFNNGQLMYSIGMELNTTTPQWLNANFSNIDSLQFSTNDHTWFAMDNFTYNETPTPIPAAIWLFGAGFAGIAGLRRRKKNIA